MMNNLLKRLPVLAFALAAIAAFAFNSPRELPDQVYAQHPLTGAWIDVSDLVEEEDYECAQSETAFCLYDSPNGNPIDPETNARFQFK